MSEHEHTSQSGEVKTEKVNYSTYSGEGCEEHYNDRYVQVQQKIVIEKKIDLKKCAEAIVLGEILGTPRAKKPFWSK